MERQEKDIHAFEEAARQLRKPCGEGSAAVVERMNSGNREIYLAAIELMEGMENKRILEIGMANGYFVKEVMERLKSCRYCGCDYSAGMVEEARKLNSSAVASGEAAFYHADANCLPFPPSSFDIVLSVNTLYFWDDPASVISGIREVLKPSGSLVTAIRPQRTMKYYPFAKFGFTLYSADSLVRLLNGCGFTVQRILEKEEAPQVIAGKEYRVESLVVLATAT